MRLLVRAESSSGFAELSSDNHYTATLNDSFMAFSGVQK